MENEESIEVQPLELERAGETLAEIKSKIMGAPARQINTQQKLYLPCRQGYYVISQFVPIDGPSDKFFSAAKGWQGNNGVRIMPYEKFERELGREIQVKLDSQLFLPKADLEIRVREAAKCALSAIGIFLREGYFLKDGTY